MHRKQKNNKFQMELNSRDALVVASASTAPQVRRLSKHFRKRDHRTMSFYPASFALRHKFAFSTERPCVRSGEQSQKSCADHEVKTQIQEFVPIAFGIKRCDAPDTDRLCTWLQQRVILLRDTTCAPLHTHFCRRAHVAGCILSLPQKNC